MVGQPVILAVFGENAGFHIVDAISKGDQAAPRLPHYRDNNFQGVDNVVDRALAEVGFVLVVDSHHFAAQLKQRRFLPDAGTVDVHAFAVFIDRNAGVTRGQYERLFVISQVAKVYIRQRFADHHAFAGFRIGFEARQLWRPVLQKLITFRVELRALHAGHRQLCSENGYLPFGQMPATTNAGIEPAIIHNPDILQLRQLLFIQHDRRHGVANRVHFLPCFSERPGIGAGKDN
ncbi:Uncharacterised protein [Klebsiella pneumoniae]|nr:Uncharacterised protein [Klebsiella pneumoniae]